MRLSQFKSAKIVDGGRVEVKGPVGDAGGGYSRQNPVPVHFAIVRDGRVMSGTGHWTSAKNWSGTSDRADRGLTPGPAYAFAMEVRFWWDEPGGNLEDAGGYMTYSWSQEIELK